MPLARCGGRCNGPAEEALGPLPSKVDRDDYSGDGPNDASEKAYVAAVQDLSDSESN